MAAHPSNDRRDLGAELTALNEQLRALSEREAARLERVLADNPDLDVAQRTHLADAITRFRQVAATELD